ncbi:hypothetical protein GGR71_002808 [Xanthomonas sp. F1]
MSERIAPFHMAMRAFHAMALRLFSDFGDRVGIFA